MFDVDESGEVEVIIQQFQSVPTAEPNKPAKKGIYVQPHWVDGGYGVHVLEPGHWTNPEKQPGRLAARSEWLAFSASSAL